VGSNHYGAEPMSLVMRWDNTKKVYIKIRIPALIKAYNKGMEGVDRCDQLLSFYRYHICTVGANRLEQSSLIAILRYLKYILLEFFFDYIS
jgi:hypothetical protein